MIRRLLLLACLLALVLAGRPSTLGGETAGQGGADEVVALTNQKRARVGLPALSTSAQLTAAAQGHSADMAARGYFAHNSPDGRTPWDRIAATGYRGTALGENIALGQPDAATVVAAWMGSPGHRANMLSAVDTEIGVGMATGAAGIYWTQDFGYRSPGNRPPPPVPLPIPTPRPAPVPDPAPIPVATGPRITALVPEHGIAGTRVTIMGAAFLPGPCYVIWTTRDGYGIRMRALVADANRVIAASPPTAVTGPVYVRRIDPAGSSVSNRLIWTLDSLPAPMRYRRP